MNRQYFIDIINKFIYGGVYNPPKDIDWFEIKRLAEIHSMVGVIGIVVSRSNIDMPIECYEFFDFSVFDCARNGIMREMRYNEITDALNSGGIPHIVVKGYILRNLYPEKDMRTMGDIDFIVEENNLEKAMPLIKEKGYTLKSVFNEEWAYEKEGMTIELHPELLDADLGLGLINYREYMSDIFNKTKLVKDNTYELNNEFHFLYMIMHTMKHFYADGCGVRMILDMALFINKYYSSLDWDYINKEIKALKIEIFAHNMFGLCHRLFNSRQIDNSTIDDELFNSVFDYIMEGGTFGFARADKFLSQGRDIIFKNKSIPLMLLKRAFPSDDEMRGLVIWYMNKPKILLPAAWIYRWFHSAIKKKGTLVTSVAAMGKSKESQKQLELLIKLGLYRK